MSDARTPVDNAELLNCLQEAGRAHENLRRLTESFLRNRFERKFPLEPGDMDVLTERVFRHLLGSVHQFEADRAAGPSSAFSFFMTCADRAAIDWIRRLKKKRSQPLPEQEDRHLPDETQPSPETLHTSEAERQAAHDSLCRALARLKTDSDRAIILLPLFLGKTDYGRIVEVMGLPSVESARTRMFRAREQMRAILAELGWDPNRVERAFL